MDTGEGRRSPKRSTLAGGGGKDLLAELLANNPAPAEGEEKRQPPTPSRKQPRSADDGIAGESYSEQLQTAQAELKARCARAAKELAGTLDAGPSSLDGAKQKRSAQMTIEWLGLQTAELAAELSKGHQWLSRQQTRVAATAFEKKLHASRTAGKVDLANQSAEMEGIISSRVQERLREMSGAGAADTYRRLEETAQELMMARYKAAGLSDAVGMSQEQLKASAAVVAELRKERSVCEVVLDTALRELEGHAPMGVTLEERVHELTRASHRQHSELDGAKVHLTTALLELDVAVDENRTLAEQVQAIVERLRASQAHVDENAALHAEGKRLRERVAALEAGEDLRAARERLASLELDRQQCDAELDVAFAELAGMQSEREGAGPRLALHDGAVLSDVARPPTPTLGEIGEIEIGEKRTDEASALSAENDAASSVSGRIKSLGSSAADRIRELVSEWRAAVEAKRELEERLLNFSVATEVERWRAEAESHRTTMSKCSERLASVVPVRQGLHGDGRPPPLPLLIEKMLDKYRGLGGKLEQMHAELQSASASLAQLQTELDKAEDHGKAQMRELSRELRAQLRTQRSTLVAVALSSLQQLRTHLVHALAGLREVPWTRQAASQGTTRLGWNPARRCWFVQPMGRVDEILLRLEMPPLQTTGVPVPAPTSPRRLEHKTMPATRPTTSEGSTRPGGKDSLVTLAPPKFGNAEQRPGWTMPTAPFRETDDFSKRPHATRPSSPPSGVASARGWSGAPPTGAGLLGASRGVGAGAGGGGPAPPPIGRPVSARAPRPFSE